MLQQNSTASIANCTFRGNSAYGSGGGLAIVASTGTLTNTDFLGADCTGTTGRPINNIASLALAARDGLIYVNVHTILNPAGEVRGQLLER